MTLHRPAAEMTPHSAAAESKAHFEWLLHCCRRNHPDSRSELQVHSSEADIHSQAPRPLSQADSFDITYIPQCKAPIRPKPLLTPGQQDFRDQLELPRLHQYPAPPGVSDNESEASRQSKLLEMYQDFVLELHTGTYLTQMMNSAQQMDIHCQLMEDLQALKVDQSNGRIIEFPLSGVSKLYRIVRDDMRWSTVENRPPHARAEHLVVIEFMRRKLAFVFLEAFRAQRFLTCMELLIRRAIQKEAEQKEELAGSHPHVVKLFEYWVDNNNSYFVTEAYNDGTLLDVQCLKKVDCGYVKSCAEISDRLVESGCWDAKKTGRPGDWENLDDRCDKTKLGRPVDLKSDDSRGPALVVWNDWQQEESSHGHRDGNFETAPEPALPVAIAPEQEFKITIKKVLGSSLGMDIDLSNDTLLIVENVGEGSFMDWNKANPGHEVKSGDSIIEVNGSRGNAHDLIELCKKDDVLECLVRRTS